MKGERTPLNVPGPFYVAKDECIACGAPEAEAPSLMAFDEDRGSCYFRRQPATPDETYRAIRAVWVSCCGAVRYAGDDPTVTARLVNIGLDGQVDVQPKRVRAPGLRTGVTFVWSIQDASASAIAVAIGRQLEAGLSRGRSDSFSPDAECAQFTWSWAPTIAGAAMRLEVCRLEERWLLRLSDVTHPAVPSVGTSIDDALRATGNARDLRWFSNYDWSTKPENWSALPV